MDRKIKRATIERLDKVDTFVFMQKEKYRTVSEDEFNYLHEILMSAIFTVKNFDDQGLQFRYIQRQ